MATQIAILSKTRTLIKTLNSNTTHLKNITTTPFLLQHPQLAEPTETHHPIPTATATATATPLPPNPATGSPLYNENWRNPMPVSTSTSSQSLIPLISRDNQFYRINSERLDAKSLMDILTDFTASKRWQDVKDLFESWVKSLDRFGKPNKPDVNIYNCYLRANLMLNMLVDDLLVIVDEMEKFAITPNTASYNLVLQAMYRDKEAQAAEKWFERMLHVGKETLPDHDSYELIIQLMFSTDQIDAALKYIDMALKFGFMLSMKVFTDCVLKCIEKGRLDTLVIIIERCKKMDQNKALCPTWKLCNHIAEIATQEDNSRLAIYALEYIAKWIGRGELAKPPVPLSVDEGLLVSALGTAGRTFNADLVDISWAILCRSLRRKKAPNPESYLGKIYALSMIGDLPKTLSTLREFESAHWDVNPEAEDMFSPFTSLNPLVVAWSKKGFETLDSVYFQLEKLTQDDPPYKSLAALNCILLGCANTADLERAYQTFEAIGSTFKLTPNIHSYNALLSAFGKLKKTEEASKVFEHLVSLGVKPNGLSYSLLVDTHVINMDAKAALKVIDEMIAAGFEPSRETLKKVRRRCVREMDDESKRRLESIAGQFNIRLGTENRKDILFRLNYSVPNA